MRGECEVCGQKRFDIMPTYARVNGVETKLLICSDCFIDRFKPITDS